MAIPVVNEKHTIPGDFNSLK